MRWLLALLCAGVAGCEPGEEAARLYAAVARAPGELYFAERDALLARADAAAILRAARDRAETEADRWLADALLVRLEHAAAFRDAQRDFKEKFDKLYSSTLPNFRHLKGTSYVGARATILVAGEELPEWGSASVFDKNRLAASPVLGPALAEIALKGVGPTTGGEADRRMPTADDYRFGAVHRLLRDGEKRAAPALLRILADPAASNRHRPAAAEILGRHGYREALPELLRLAEDEKATPALRHAAFGGIASLALPDAIPTLERIVARGEGAPRQPGNLGPRRWASEAALALRAIRAKQ